MPIDVALSRVGNIKDRSCSPQPEAIFHTTSNCKRLVKRKEIVTPCKKASDSVQRGHGTKQGRILLDRRLWMIFLENPN